MVPPISLNRPFERLNQRKCPAQTTKLSASFVFCIKTDVQKNSGKIKPILKEIYSWSWKAEDWFPVEVCFLYVSGNGSEWVRLSHRRKSQKAEGKRIFPLSQLIDLSAVGPL